MLPSKCIHSPGNITTMDPFTATAPKPSAALTGPTAHAVHKLTMDGLYIQPRHENRVPAMLEFGTFVGATPR